ncbi:MAG: hypothetical protein Q9190_005964 [Brigantiaea leucoxantha]
MLATSEEELSQNDLRGYLSNRDVLDSLLTSADVPLYFLDRSELWKTVKPYNFQYYPKEDFPRNNFLHSPYITRIKSMRSRDPPVCLATEGFEIHHLDTKMKYSDFTNQTMIEETYCRELEAHFKEALGAKNVRALDFQVTWSSVYAFVHSLWDSVEAESSRIPLLRRQTSTKTPAKFGCACGYE